MLKFPIVFMSLMLFACGQQNAKNNNVTTVTASKPAAATNVPEFNADSAYTYVEKQVAFGPRRYQRARV